MGNPTAKPGNIPANENAQPTSPFTHKPRCQVWGDNRKQAHPPESPPHTHAILGAPLWQSWS